jgi:secondary thiamine-phosphate synthase enzyme
VECEIVAIKIISLPSKGHGGIIYITPQIEREVTNMDINNGTVTIFIPSSSDGISTIEFEPSLVACMQAIWQRDVPVNIPYHQDYRWGDGNGHSRVRASLLGFSLVAPFNNKRLTLGIWQ